MLLVIIFIIIAIVGIFLTRMCTYRLHMNLMLLAIKHITGRRFSKSQDIIDEYKKLCIKYEVSPVEDPDKLLLKVLTNVRRRNSVSK